MFFQYFDKIVFEGITFEDIFSCYRIPEELRDNIFLQKYSVLKGERPDITALKIYGDENLWWVILLYLKITDPFYQWPMEGDEIERWGRKEAERVYGEDYTMAQLVTILDTFMARNDDYIQIEVLHPSAISDLIRDIGAQFDKAGR